MSLIKSLFVSVRSSKAHPGPVVHISDNPMDEGKVNLHEPKAGAESVECVLLSYYLSEYEEPPRLLLCLLTTNEHFLCLNTLMSLKWDFPGVKALLQKRPSGFVTFFNNRRCCK